MHGLPSCCVVSVKAPAPRARHVLARLEGESAVGRRLVSGGVPLLGRRAGLSTGAPLWAPLLYSQPQACGNLELGVLPVCTWG
jgi:hypothetical protein